MEYDDSTDSGASEGELQEKILLALKHKKLVEGRNREKMDVSN